MATANEAPVRLNHRLYLPAGTALLNQQVRWTLVHAAVFAGALVLFPTQLAPYFALVLAAGMALVCAQRRGLARRLAGACLLVTSPFALSAMTDAGALGSALSFQASSQPDISGSAILFLGGATGLAAAWAVPKPNWSLRPVLAGLGGCAAAGIGWWIASSLVMFPLAHAGSTVAVGLLMGLATSQLLPLLRLESQVSNRLPSSRTVVRTLRPTYAQPCMQAMSLDSHLAKTVPDTETRDGLGEVAAWVYRLQWTLQALDVALEESDPLSLQERICDLTQQAKSTSDLFARERLLATVGHLERLQDHRTALLTERTRTSVLSDYALAFLEEAKTGLALARVQPGTLGSERLDEVLERLERFQADRASRRQAAHEVSP